MTFIGGVFDTNALLTDNSMQNSYKQSIRLSFFSPELTIIRSSVPIKTGAFIRTSAMQVRIGAVQACILPVQACIGAVQGCILPVQ